VRTAPAARHPLFYIIAKEDRAPPYQTDSDSDVISGVVKFCRNVEPRHISNTNYIIILL